MSEFGNLNLDEMAGEDARLKEQGGSASFLEQFVPMPDVKVGQVGSVAVRILPPMKGGKLFQYNRTHKLNGRSIHCPRPLINGKWDRNVACPICDFYASLWKKIDAVEKAQGKDCPEAKALKAQAGALKPIERYYYNAIVRSMVVDGKEMKNVGPRILSVGKLLHSSIIGAIVGREGDPDSKLGNITDLKAGWDFVIRKEVTAGEEAYPNYAKSSFARSQAPTGSPEEIAKWQEALHDLTKLRNPKDVEYLERELAIHKGLIPDDTESFDNDAFEARWKSKSEDDVADMVSNSTGVKTTVAAGAQAPSQPIVVEVAAQETLAIEDEDFLRQLADMKE